jgi:hypothetical protein
MKYFFLLLSLIVSSSLRAQEQDTGYVNIHADPKLAMVVKKPAGNKIYIGKARGFRVQIYNGNDRKKASQAKVDFMRQFPGVRSYLIYNNPQFRVRVGDFTSRKGAMELYNKLSGTFNPSMIVPDIVNLNTAKNKGKDKPKETAEEDDDQ